MLLLIHGTTAWEEPRKDQYENIDEASPLNIERKEVVAPVPTQFKAQVTDSEGNKLITTPDEKKVDIIIPEINKETLEVKIKGGYWGFICLVCRLLASYL